jgi:hypothetical protein
MTIMKFTEPDAVAFPTRLAGTIFGERPKGKCHGVDLDPDSQPSTTNTQPFPSGVDFQMGGSCLAIGCHISLAIVV